MGSVESAARHFLTGDPRRIACAPPLRNSHKFIWRFPQRRRQSGRASNGARGSRQALSLRRPPKLRQHARALHHLLVRYIATIHSRRLGGKTRPASFASRAHDPQPTLLTPFAPRLCCSLDASSYATSEDFGDTRLQLQRGAADLLGQVQRFAPARGGFDGDKVAVVASSGGKASVILPPTNMGPELVAATSNVCADGEPNPVAALKLALVSGRRLEDCRLCFWAASPHLTH